MRLYAVVLYFGSSGDEIRIFRKRADAEACALEYMQTHWNVEGSVSECPDSYAEAAECFDHESFDNRFDLQECKIE
jgi:hypothetical protein